MKNRTRFLAAVVVWAGCLGLLIDALPSRADPSPADPVRAHPFFAMNFERFDSKISSSPEAQAALLKQLGYDGSQYLGSLEDMERAFTAMEAQGLRMFTAALMGSYNVSVDPGTQFDPALKDMIQRLQGRNTLLVIGFASKKYERSSPEGDPQAVAAAQQLADYAQRYGVRVAVYPHVNLWCERVEDAVRIVKKADRKNLGMCFNLFHWMKTDKERNLEPLVRLSLPHLFLVTINGISPEGSYATLDRGSREVSEFLKSFFEAGYHGPIGLQCWGIEGDARENLTRSMQAWRMLRAELAR